MKATVFGKLGRIFLLALAAGLVVGACSSPKSTPSSRSTATSESADSKTSVERSVSGVAGTYIYWANTSGNTIGRANLNGTDVIQNFISGANGPGDVVVYGHRIYWANADGCTEYGSCNGSIGAANLDGTDVNERFIPTNTAYGLAISSQYIYWTNFGSNTIGRANLDGTDVKQNFISGANGPDGVVVISQSIYWSNAGSDTIGRANVDGTDINQDFVTAANGPQGMAIDSQHIYWANHNNGTIGRASLDGTDVDQRFIVGAGNFPTRVTVNSQHILWTAWTKNSIPSPGTIGEANLDGTDVVKTLISSANSPVGVFAEDALLRGVGNSQVSTIASSLPTPSEAFSPARSIAVNGGIAAAIAMILTFPSQLFNETLQENYAEIVGWWRRRLRLSPKAANDRGATGEVKNASTSLRRDRAVFAVVVLAGAVVNSLNDGHFGFKTETLITFIAVVLTIVAGVAISATVAGVYHAKRHGDTSRRLQALPAGLAIAAGLVVFSRVIGFEPGYLYGVICGVIFTRELADNEKGHLAALGVLTTMGVSVVAWLIWIPVNNAAQHHGAFFGVVLADDFFAALFVGGLVGSFFGMVPIKGLPGWTVKQWNLAAWVAGFGLATFGLCQILLRPGIVGHGHRPLVASVILFVAFGLGSIAFHEHFEDKRRLSEGELHPSFTARVRTLARHARFAPSPADPTGMAEASTQT